MTSAARIAASFMLALFATVGPMVLAVLFPWKGFEGAAGSYIAVVLLMLLPMTIVSGLAGRRADRAPCGGSLAPTREDVAWDALR